MRAITLLHTLAAVLAVSGVLPAYAAERHDSVEGDLSQRSRALTESACAQAGDVAAALGSTVQALQGDFARALAQTRADAVRELTPLMHRLADQLRGLARELEQSRAAGDS